MIVTVYRDRTDRAVAGFAGENADERATSYMLSADDPDALVSRRSSGTRIAGIQVRDLIPGDVLLPSQTAILSRPVAGVRTPTGKLELSVASAKGRRRTVTWGRYTKTAIIRHTNDDQEA